MQFKWKSNKLMSVQQISICNKVSNSQLNHSFILFGYFESQRTSHSLRQGCQGSISISIKVSISIKFSIDTVMKKKRNFNKPIDK